MSGEPTGQSDSRSDGLEGERAYLLSEGTDYVTGWMQANHATLALRAALRAVSARPPTSCAPRSTFLGRAWSTWARSPRTLSHGSPTTSAACPGV